MHHHYARAVRDPAGLSLGLGSLASAATSAAPSIVAAAPASDRDAPYAGTYWPAQDSPGGLVQSEGHPYRKSNDRSFECSTVTLPRAQPLLPAPMTPLWVACACRRRRGPTQRGPVRRPAPLLGPHGTIVYLRAHVAYFAQPRQPPPMTRAAPRSARTAALPLRPPPTKKLAAPLNADADRTCAATAGLGLRLRMCSHTLGAAREDPLQQSGGTPRTIVIMGHRRLCWGVSRRPRRREPTRQALLSRGLGRACDAPLHTCRERTCFRAQGR